MATEDQVHLRLGEDVKRVDLYAEYMKHITGIEFTRADAVRSLINRALDIMQGVLDNAMKKGK
jgi:hypothetical protein